MADGELHDEDLSSCIEQSECPSKNTEAIINSDNIVHQQQEQSVPQADEHENNVQVITNATTSIDTSKHDSNHATAPGEACDDECRELKEKCTIESIPNESDERMSTDVTDSETKTEKAPDSWHILADNLKLLVSSYKEFDSNNYLRGCKWAPDGSCLLTCSNDNKMRLYNLPSELYSGVVDDLPEMTPVLSMQQGESVYDFCWYPKMSSWEPNTCCFITTCKDHPVHLWDAFYHHKRASYVAYNHVDEVTSPHSVCFSLDGERIYAGFNKCIRVFNTSRPGREYNTMATYEKKYGGQTGIISCIAMNPAIPGMFALGSYSCSVGLYDDGICGTTMLLSGVHSGVTHMVFSRDGNYLFIGYRKNGKILCWDLRSPDIVLSTMEREVNTNQRVYFDLYSSERYLISGSTSGHVYGWSLDCTTESDVVTSNEDAIIQPSCLKSVAHTDSVNGCSVHPSLPLLATCSGQRTFHLPNSGSDESSESEGEDKMELDSVRTENSIKIWSLLGASNCGSYEEIRKHFMVPLHKILEHPKGIPIAERLIKRNRTGSIKYEKDEEALPPTCCRHCQLTLQLDRITSSQCDTITGCLDLQNQIHKLLEPDIDSSVTTESRCQVMLPRFFSLSPTTQCNFVSLLHHHIHQLPPTLLEQFIATLKPHLYYENDWCAFLVQSLEMKMIKPTDTDITEMKTPISGDTLEKLKCVAFSFRTSSSSTESRHEVIHDTSRLAGITVSSVWDQEEHYSDIETPAISFTEDVVAAPNAHDDEEVVEVSCLPRKKRKLDTSDVEDHLVSSRSKKLKLDEEEPRLDLSPQLAPMSTQATEVTDISDDVLEAAQMTWQRWLEGKAADEKLFQALISLEQTQFTQVLNQVSNPPEALPGDAIPVLIKNLIESQSDVSYINAVTLLKLTALPKIAGMGLSTHRLLISALSSLLTALPHQTIDGLLCPLMQNPHFVSSQAVCRLVKDKMTEEQRNLFWRKMLDLEVNTAGEPFVWSEHTLAVVQTLVDKKVTLDSHGVEKLMGILSRSAADLTKSVKFGCFIKDLCTRYSKIMSPATTDLLDIALSHKSSLKNLLVKTVKKLA